MVAKSLLFNFLIFMHAYLCKSVIQISLMIDYLLYDLAS